MVTTAYACGFVSLKKFNNIKKETYIQRITESYKKKIIVEMYVIKIARYYNL